MAAAALETNMLFKAGAEPRGAATGSMRILMIRMYQRLNTTANVLFASALHTGVWSPARSTHEVHCVAPSAQLWNATR